MIVSDETAKQLARSIDRLAEAIEGVKPQASAGFLKSPLLKETVCSFCLSRHLPTALCQNKPGGL